MTYSRLPIKDLESINKQLESISGVLPMYRGICKGSYLWALYEYPEIEYYLKYFELIRHE